MESAKNYKTSYRLNRKRPRTISARGSLHDAMADALKFQTENLITINDELLITVTDTATGSICYWANAEGESGTDLNPMDSRLNIVFIALATA